MNPERIVITFVAGFVVGIVVAYIFRYLQTKRLEESFENLSRKALSQATEEFLKLAKDKLGSEREINVQELDTKKELIDQQLKRMSGEMEKVSTVIKELEKDRVEKFGELAAHLRSTNEQTASLSKITSSLKEALASSKTRGQWGERMAEDVLKLAGFIENINYLKQKSIDGTGTIPDFTFLLPRDLTVNMDVKFPFDNYIKFLETDSESEKERFRKDFLKDVKNRVKEVTTRNYINPDQNTLDYVILFIPNEQIYGFIHECDSSILDEGIKNKVVFCSPVTLFAVLAVIRQAVDNFNMESASKEMLSLFGRFHKEWSNFTLKLEEVEKKMEALHKTYAEVMGTRRRQLEKPLNQIDGLRIDRGLPIASMDGGGLQVSDKNEV